MLSNRDWIPTLKLAGVKMPDIFNCKILQFLYSPQMFSESNSYGKTNRKKWNLTHFKKVLIHSI